MDTGILKNQPQPITWPISYNYFPEYGKKTKIEIS